MRQLASLIFAFSLRCCFQEVSKWDVCCQIFVDGELDNCAIHLDTVAPKIVVAIKKGEENAVGRKLNIKEFQRTIVQIPNSAQLDIDSSLNNFV